MVFEKRMTFRRRRDEKDDAGPSVASDADYAMSSRGALAPEDAGPIGFRRNVSPGAQSRLSTANSIDRQFFKSSKPGGGSKDGDDGMDPVGLKVIYHPPGERVADIIFIHGLGGSSRRSWAKNRDLDYFWPYLWLPSEPEIENARISTFGYSANFRSGSGKSKMSVLDFGKDLLYALKYARDDERGELADLQMGDKPIIFVAHSMGGLVVKEAFVQGQNDPHFEDIVRAVSSIVFLSTPHRGTMLAEMLNRILTVSLTTDAKQFIADIANNSHTIQRLNEQFRHVAPKLHIVSFYETRPTAMLKKQVMVLDKDSSILGYPGEISKPIDGDHHGVCKFDDPRDPRYRNIRDILITLIAKSQPTVIDEEPFAEPQRQVSFDEFLCVPEKADIDLDFFRDRWSNGTCKWILENKTFLRWLGNTQLTPRALWIHGNAGSGKSILSSFIVNHLFELHLPCHYFFVRFTDKRKRTLGSILRSIACQLAETLPQYAEHLTQLQAAATDLRSADYKTVWQRLYKQTLFQISVVHPIYIVVDGVDESDAPGALIRLFSELENVSSPLRFLLISRKTHEISTAIQRLNKQIDVDSIHVEGLTADLRAYIDQEMDLAGDNAYAEEIATKLLDRATGNFLWVHLAVQKINACITKDAVDEALKDLPSGMEALYDRMASAVQNQPGTSDRTLALEILGWAVCAQRMLGLEELSDALANKDILEVQKTIGDLCGGFVVIDKMNKVAMIHETAREYLLRQEGTERPLVIDRRATNDSLFHRCITRLMDARLRTQITRGQPPALLGYASNSWFIHLLLGNPLRPNNLDTALKFMQTQQILTWIHVAAQRRELKTLVVASRYMSDIGAKLKRVGDDGSLRHHQIVNLFEGWATDLIKIVGKFGNNLYQDPDSIYKLIPPLCPEGSAIYQQFGKKEAKSLRLSGYSSTVWDDCLARLSSAQGIVASSVLAAGSRVFVLTNARKMSHVIVYDAATFEEQRKILHDERVFKMQTNRLGNRLLTYGYLTTRIWDTTTGDLIAKIKNPPKRPQPHTIVFLEDENVVMVGGQDRCIRSFSLDDEEPAYQTVAQVDEERTENTIVNFPLCSTLSPDGTMIAFSYRNHPVTAWDLAGSPMLIGTCSLALDESKDRTMQQTTFGEVFSIAWHPTSGEVLGLTQVGVLFKWNPSDEETNASVHGAGDRLSVSPDGAYVATGDSAGAIRVYISNDLSLIYQLSSSNVVLDLCFSIDSRRLYDTRGSHSNVWEPSTLVRLAESMEFSDHSSDMLSETQSLAKLSLHTEHNFARLDNVITLSSQPCGTMYAYGTEEGVAVLCEVGIGKVGELERLPNFMSIEHVVWSSDGKTAAIADLSGKVSVKNISKSGDGSWETSHNFDVVISPNQGHIEQLVFHPSTPWLFIYTAAKIYRLDLQTHEVVEASVSDDLPNVRWMCVASIPEMLLGFGNSKVFLMRWSDLQLSDTLLYFPPRLLQTTTFTQSSVLASRPSIRPKVETLGRLVTSADSSVVLLELTHLDEEDQTARQFMTFSIDQIQRTLATVDPDEPLKKLSYSAVPNEITAKIREPLAILSRGRLAFLDVDRWVCTWRLPSSTPPQARSTSDTSQLGIEQHYFLPGDWVTTNDAHLCTIMPDGTLLFPRNGEVANVQYAKLKR